MKITIIPEEHCIECNGIKYSFEMFERLGVRPEGTYFQIVSREDGMITVTKFDPPDLREGGFEYDDRSKLS